MVRIHIIIFELSRNKYCIVEQRQVQSLTLISLLKPGDYKTMYDEVQTCHKALALDVS